MKRIKQNDIMGENDPLPNKRSSHLVKIVPMAPYTPKSTLKLRSALHFRYSIVIPRFIPRDNTAQSLFMLKEKPKYFVQEIYSKILQSNLTFR